MNYKNHIEKINQSLWKLQEIIEIAGVDRLGHYLHYEDSLQVLNNLTEDLNAE